MVFLQKQKHLLFILTGIFITLWPAFYNHYVFFFTDSEVYINCGNTFSTVEDRSFIYGFFVGITSLYTSLWFTIIVQAFLFNVIFYVFLKKITGVQFHPVLYLSLVVGLSIFTALGWDVCYIMPDIFSSISIMLLYLLVFHFPQKLWQALLLIIIYLYCAQMHFSYMIAHVLVLTLLFILRLTYTSFIPLLRLKHILLLLCLAIVNMGLYRVEKQLLGGKHSFSNASTVFLMGKMVENGVLKKYLDEQCSTKHYEICNYKDSLSLNNLCGTFIWVSSSAFNRTGGWNVDHPEYSVILKDIYTTPKYAALFCYRTGIETLKSLGQYKIFTSFYTFPRDGWGPHPAIVKYYPNEIPRYDHSRQNTNTLFFPFKTISYCYLFLLITSLLAVLLLYKNNIFVLGYFLFALLANALVTGGLVALYDRYATRQDWLIIVLACIFAYTAWRKKQPIKTE